MMCRDKIKTKIKDGEAGKCSAVLLRSPAVSSGSWRCERVGTIPRKNAARRKNLFQLQVMFGCLKETER